VDRRVWLVVAAALAVVGLAGLVGWGTPVPEPVVPGPPAATSPAPTPAAPSGG